MLSFFSIFLDFVSCRQIRPKRLYFLQHPFIFIAHKGVIHNDVNTENVSVITATTYIGSLDESNMVVRSFKEGKLHCYQIAKMKCTHSFPSILTSYVHFDIFQPKQFQLFHMYGLSFHNYVNLKYSICILLKNELVTASNNIIILFIGFVISICQV